MFLYFLSWAISIRFVENSTESAIKSNANITQFTNKWKRMNIRNVENNHTLHMKKGKCKI